MQQHKDETRKFAVERVTFATQVGTTHAPIYDEHKWSMGRMIHGRETVSSTIIEPT